MRRSTGLLAAGLVTASVLPGDAVLAAPAAADFQRGDADADSRLDLRDAIFTLTSLHAGGARPPCEDAADANHLAFTYFPSRELLALPITVCEGGSGPGFGERMTFSGLLVYRVSLAAGFDRLGGVPHAVESPEFSCRNWWTRSNSIVQRGIFMDDFVWSVALDRLDVARVDDLAHPVASVALLGRG